MSLRFLTAGESHGPGLVVIVEGLPSGVPADVDRIDRDLRRRMGGHGRGGRMRIERDHVEIVGGVRFGRTLGSPVGLLIRNRDHVNWSEAMATNGDPPQGGAARSLSRPRPGHADLAGALKFHTHDARPILERASARETAARTAAGALARSLLLACGIEVTSRTIAVGRAVAASRSEADFDSLLDLADDAPMRVVDAASSEALIAEVDAARRAGDSIGGAFEVLARNVPPGLGSHVHWDRRLDGRLGGALLSIPGVKAASIGEGIACAEWRGSETHDAILYDSDARCFRRSTNRAGGIEGGMSNGEILRVSGYLKPVATLPRPLPSVDLITKQPFAAAQERTDTIPIVAAGIVGEATCCLVLADELMRKFGGDRLDETIRNLEAYRQDLRRF